jgi:glutathione S-transferase
MLIFVERKRDADKCSDAWIAQQTGKIHAGLNAIDALAASFEGRTDIGVLAVAASVGWLEFRSVVPGIRDGRPHLAEWMDEISQQGFMKDTAPPPGA